VTLTAGRQLGKAPYVRVETKPISATIQPICESGEDAIRSERLADWDERERARAIMAEANSKRMAGDATGCLQMLSVAMRLVAQRYAQ
jgi:hypothetical protein